MKTETVKTVIECDVCRNKEVLGDVPHRVSKFKYRGRLVLSCNMLDMHQEPIMQKAEELDLCDSCFARLNDLVGVEIGKIREELSDG